MLRSLKIGKVELSLDNSATLRNLITQLAQGIDKVEITLEDFRKQFDKPLSPNEAIDVLTKYIDHLCAGKERNKVRIIIK